MMTSNLAKIITSKKRQFCLALAFVMLLSVFAVPCNANAETISEINQKLAEVNKELESLEEEASKLHEQADSLQREIKILQNEQNTLRKRIELKQAEHDRIVLDIEATQKRIDDNNEAIGYAIAQYYYSGEVSTIERIASAQSFSSFLDQEVSISSLSDTLFAIIEENKALKTELVAKKNEAERIMHDLEDQKAALAEKEKEQARLLAQTKSDEAKYQEQSAAKKEERDELRKKQAEIIRAQGGSSTPGDPSKGGYPYSDVCPEKQDWYPDPWGMYICECVSYAAWKVEQNYGNMPYWGGIGNANQWPANARAMGITVSDTPKAGTVGIMMSGYYGHAVWVEWVNDDGSVHVSQYNALNDSVNYWGEYSEQDFPASAFVYLYFEELNN